MGRRLAIPVSEATVARPLAATKVIDHGTRHTGFRHGVANAVRDVAPRFLAGVVSVMVIASAIGLLLTHVFEHSALVRLDVRLDNTLAANRTPRLDSLTGVGTFFADPLPVATALLLAIVIAACVVRHWRAPVFLAVAVGGEKLSYYLSTLIVNRPRPQVPTVGQVHVTSSFPSGHVGSAISLWASIALLVMTVVAGRLRTRAVVVALLVGLFFASEVGFSRLYRGHHFLTDVLVGAAIGTVWVILSYRIVLAPYLEETADTAG